ncbi:MAG: SulP family inorganic anion transporter, partial [Chlamydiia bacterium]|nr:SulP family inorganic anion transporter [Chlamydiia bacterium]
GAKSPLSGMFHSLFLLLFVCVGAGLMRFIPMPVLAAILFLVAAGMSEAHRFLQILRLSGADRVLLCATFLLTVFVDLTVAIAFGVTVASLSFAAQMSKAVEVARGGETKEHQDRDQRVDLPEGADAFYIEGPIFFGIAGELIDLFTLAGSPPKVLIIRMGAVPYLDASGAYALVQLLEHCQRIGTTLVFSSLRPQPERLLKEFHPIGIRSEPNYGKAVELARDLLS